jgi:hypothetical protein
VVIQDKPPFDQSSKSASHSSEHSIRHEDIWQGENSVKLNLQTYFWILNSSFRRARGSVRAGRLFEKPRITGGQLIAGMWRAVWGFDRPPIQQDHFGIGFNDFKVWKSCKNPLC